MNTRPPYVTQDENNGGLLSGAALSLDVFFAVSLVCARATPNRPALAAATDAKKDLTTDRREGLTVECMGNASGASLGGSFCSQRIAGAPIGGKRLTSYY
jgi:hypothetical protein